MFPHQTRRNGISLRFPTRERTKDPKKKERKKGEERIIIGVSGGRKVNMRGKGRKVKRTCRKTGTGEGRERQREGGKDSAARERKKKKGPYMCSAFSRSEDPREGKWQQLPQERLGSLTVSGSLFSLCIYKTTGSLGAGWRRLKKQPGQFFDGNCNKSRS